MSRFLIALALLLAKSFLFAIPVCSLAIEQRIAVSPEQLARWMIIRGDSAPPAVKAKMREIDDSFEIVFIPGIMGSKLKIGKYEFGDGKVDAKSLALRNPNEAAPAEILERYSAFWTEFDVYRPGLILLGLGSKGRRIKTFPYDWRLDLDQTIDKFQEYAKRELKNKRVIIVAHSMGAVLAWHWKNNYAAQEVGRYPSKRKTSKSSSRGERPFELVALVVVGAPLRGSCEVARMLVQGYSAADHATGSEKIGIGLLFAGAHPAIFTFPSAFELLPSDGGCLKVKDGNNYADQDLLRIGTWHNNGYSAIRKFAKEAGFDTRDEYLSLVQGAINAAARFRTKFDTSQRDDRVFFLYSQSFPMQSGYLAETKDDWLRLNTGALRADKSGDGRVIKESAYPENPDGVIGLSWPLSSGHDRLINDKEFSQFLTDVLSRYIKEHETKLLAAEFVKDPSLASELHAIGWVISPGTAQYASSPEYREAQATIARYNASLFREHDQDEVNALVKAAMEYDSPSVDRDKLFLGWTLFTRGELNRVSPRARTSTSLYESALLIAPDRVKPSVLMSLAHRKVAERNFDEAIAHAVQARDILEQDKTASNADRATAWAVLSRVYASANAPVVASQAMAQARALGYPLEFDAQAIGELRGKILPPRF